MKVDVCINVFGKPWQTLCTLKSLMLHSGEHIDKIFLIKELKQPHGDSIDWILDYFDNLIVFTPDVYSFSIDQSSNHNNAIRYQYGFDHSNKTFIFITHNDVLYTDDVIGKMLEKIGTSIGIGEIGQCWNCPAGLYSKNEICSGEKFYEWNPTYDEVISLGLPYKRTTADLIDHTNPKPLPECRLNEWACLINRDISNKETSNGTPFFGTYDSLDIGSAWFRSLVLKGYKFVALSRAGYYHHNYWGPGQPGGVSSDHDRGIYSDNEQRAKEYYYKHFNN